MSIEIKENKLTLNNVDPFLILILLGDKVIDKSVVSNIASPDFSIVVRPSDRPNCTTKEGDYTIVVRKDSGEETTLVMPHRGAKVLYVLTLLCQKVVGGLPTKYFVNERAAAVIEALYDKLYRSGGEQWVKNCMENGHNISIYRTHAMDAMKANEALDNVLRYWCAFEDENERRIIGKNYLQLRRIRIPNDRIIFEDAARNRVTFEQLMEQLPPFEELFGFKNKTTKRLRELRSKKASDSFTRN